MITNRPSLNFFFQNSKTIFCISIIATAIIFFLIQNKAPFLYDDFDFLFKYQKTDSGEWVCKWQVNEGVEDIINACHTHRETKNGRVSDLLAICALNTLGKNGFAILNTLIATLFIVLYMKLSALKYNLYNLLLFLTISLFIIADIRTTVFWNAGACNYLWGGVAFGFFLFFYRKIRIENNSSFIIFGGYISSFITCSIHEMLGITTVGMIILDMFIRHFIFKDKKFRIEILFFAIAGFSVTLSAPSIWCRINHDVVQRTFDFSSHIFAIIYHSSIPILILAVCIWKQRKKIISKPEFLFSICNLFALLIIGNSNSRVGFYFTIGTLLLFLKTFSIDNIKYKKTLSVCTLIYLAQWSFFYYSYNSFTDQALKLAKLNTTDNKVIVYDVYDTPNILSNEVLLAGIYNRGYTPHIERSFIYWECKPFSIVFNALVNDRQIYKLFNGSDADKYQVLYSNNMCYIRFPKGVPTNSLTKFLSIYDKNGKKIGVAETFIGKHFLGRLKARYFDKLHISRYSIDFDNDFYYLIVAPAPIGRGHIELPHAQNKESTKISLESTIMAPDF